MDDIGQVVGYDDYDAWGYILPGRSLATGTSTVAGAAKNKFTGKEWDDELGLRWYHFGARYYDPEVGRWTSVDPALHKWAPGQVLPAKLDGLSPYIYVRDNPLILIDPDGYVDWKRVVLGTATLVSGILEVGGGTSLAASPTGAGQVAGAALITHGSATAAFGFANIVAGFADADEPIPSGPMEMVGMAATQATGNESFQEIGQITDTAVQVISGGNPLKAGSSLPTSAREAGLMGKTQVLKETIKAEVNAASQLASTVQLVKQTNDVIQNEEQKQQE